MESIRERTWDHAQCVPSTEEELSCPELKRITYYPASHRKILHIKQSPFSRTFYLQRIMIGFKIFFFFLCIGRRDGKTNEGVMLESVCLA